MVTFDSGESSGAFLNGFTITGGAASAATCTEGGGIFISSASPTLSNNIISNNSSGIGVTGSSSSPLIEGNDVTTNTYAPVDLSSCATLSGIGGGGGGVNIHIVGSPRIIGNTIEQNQFDLEGSGSSAQGAGIAVRDVNDLDIENNIIRNNAAGSSAGVLIKYNDNMCGLPFI